MLTTARRRTRAGNGALIAVLSSVAIGAVAAGSALTVVLSADPGSTAQVAAGADAGTDSTAALRIAVGTARLAVDGLGTVTLGLVLAPLLLTAGARARWMAEARSRAARWAVFAATGWSVAVLLAVWLRAAEASGTSAAAVRPAALVTYATDLADGRGLVLTLCCGLLVAGLAVGAVGRPGGRSPEVAIGAAILGLLPGPVTGHASGHLDRGWAVVLIALHVVAAAVWVGGLVALALVASERPPVLVAALTGFGSVAGYCAGLVGVTGVLSAVLRLPGPGALFGTGYGVLVLAKAAGLLVVLGLAWRLRRGMAGSAGTASAPVQVRRRLAMELAVLAAVFGLASALAGSAPT